MAVAPIYDDAGGTLAVAKNTHMAFRSEGDGRLSEGVVACLVPGARPGNPVDETFSAAWKSLRGLGDKRVGPKIGTIRASQQDTLSHFYGRSNWHSSPGHRVHRVASTSQAAPVSGQMHKRMRVA